MKNILYTIIVLFFSTLYSLPYTFTYNALPLEAYTNHIRNLSHYTLNEETLCKALSQTLINTVKKEPINKKLPLSGIYLNYLWFLS